MSDLGVAAALDELEAMLRGRPEDLSADAIEQWHVRFREALADAERGPRWREHLDRAHRLGQDLDRVLGVLLEQRETLRKELDVQGQGARALRAYLPR